ncbi:MAG: ThuA domain-containing protein [Oscillospiraceae bacterium]|nr:ThuA domain-containing protein [Oscillospiraceae bacterium]
MAQKKKAMIVWGGWEGHEPDLVAERFEGFLKSIDMEVDVFTDLEEAYGDVEYLKSLHLICPIWTMGKLEGPLVKNVSLAVASGVGMAGNHGGMCDSFRENTEWQFITGGNWVSHPGGLIDYAVNIKKDAKHPIIEGLEDFEVFSEQYYLHVDPAVEVLATTRFPNPNTMYYHNTNKPTDMPVAWIKCWGHGRIFYTSLGHTDIVFEDAPNSEIMVQRGMRWAIEGKDIAIRDNLDPDVFLSGTKNF